MGLSYESIAYLVAIGWVYLLLNRNVAFVTNILLEIASLCNLIIFLLRQIQLVGTLIVVGRMLPSRTTTKNLCMKEMKKLKVALQNCF